MSRLLASLFVHVALARGETSTQCVDGFPGEDGVSDERVLAVTHPIRLGLDLNHSVFMYVVLPILGDAIADFDKVAKDPYEELTAEWLRFVTGMVDYEDLPQNISCEILQPNEIERVIRKFPVMMCLVPFAENMETSYSDAGFNVQFGKSMKQGEHEDSTTRTKVAIGPRGNFGVVGQLEFFRAYLSFSGVLPLTFAGKKKRDNTKLCVRP